MRVAIVDFCCSGKFIAKSYNQKAHSRTGHCWKKDFGYGQIASLDYLFIIKLIWFNIDYKLMN